MGIPTSRVSRLQIEICAVSTADAIATGEVNCYNCIVRCRRFTETIGQGYYSAVQPHLSCEDMGCGLLLHSILAVKSYMKREQEVMHRIRSANSEKGYTTTAKDVHRTNTRRRTIGRTGNHA